MNRRGFLRRASAALGVTTGLVWIGQAAAATGHQLPPSPPMLLPAAASSQSTSSLQALIDAADSQTVPVPAPGIYFGTYQDYIFQTNYFSE